MSIFRSDPERRQAQRFIAVEKDVGTIDVIQMAALQ
jgi:hypothetical protein